MCWAFYRLLPSLPLSSAPALANRRRSRPSRGVSRGTYQNKAADLKLERLWSSIACAATSLKRVAACCLASGLCTAPLGLWGAVVQI